MGPKIIVNYDDAASVISDDRRTEYAPYDVIVDIYRRRMEYSDDAVAVFFDGDDDHRAFHDAVADID